MIVRVDCGRRGVETHLRFVDRLLHGFEGGPDARVVREGLLVRADYLAHLQDMEDSLLVFVDDEKQRRMPNQRTFSMIFVENRQTKMGRRNSIAT